METDAKGIFKLIKDSVGLEKKKEKKIQMTVSGKLC